MSSITVTQDVLLQLNLMKFMVCTLSNYIDCPHVYIYFCVLECKNEFKMPSIWIQILGKSRTNKHISVLKSVSTRQKCKIFYYIKLSVESREIDSFSFMCRKRFQEFNLFQ